MVYKHFLHIGKTGGTAVREALAPIAEAHGIVLHGHHTRLWDIPEDDAAFFFLRDPVSRFVSAFNSRLRQGRPRWNTPWNEEETWAFARYANANDLAEDLNTPCGQRAVAGIRHVNTHYSDWLRSADYALSRRLAFVGRQETLNRDFENLTHRLGLHNLELPDDPVLRHATPSNFSTNISSKARSNLTVFYRNDYAMVEQLRPLWEPPS